MLIIILSTYHTSQRLIVYHIVRSGSLWNDVVFKKKSNLPWIWFRDLRIRIWGPEIKRLKAHKYFRARFCGATPLKYETFAFLLGLSVYASGIAIVLYNVNVKLALKYFRARFCGATPLKYETFALLLGLSAYASEIEFLLYTVKLHASSITPELRHLLYAYTLQIPPSPTTEFRLYYPKVNLFSRLINRH